MIIQSYSKKFCTVMRLIVLISLLVLMITNVFKLTTLLQGRNVVPVYIDFSVVIINYIVCIICILLLIFPTNFLLISFVCLLYAILISIVEPENHMNLFMSFLSFSCLMVSGAYSKRKRQKIIITIIVCLLIIFVPLFFSKSEFLLKEILEIIGYTLVYTINVFLLRFHYSTNFLKSNILNIANYPKLTKRDAEWLNAIMKKEKYENIAREYNLSEGYIRNRIKFIYDELGIDNKIDFFNKYDHFQIVFDENV